MTSNATPSLFHLTAGGDLKPVTATDQDLPANVSGLPAFYYWKDAIVVGSYIHPTAAFSLDITRDRLDGYINNFRKMQINGVGVPILMDHTQSAAATLGWIVDLKREDDRLLELHQFLGEEARDIGLRNKVSLGIDPDFVDGKGVRYGEAIVHSAVTPVPVVPGQGGFEAISTGDEHERGIVTLSLAEPYETTSGVLALPPGEGGGEGSTWSDSLSVKAPSTAAPHPNPLPEGEGTRALQLALAALIDAASAKRDLAIARGGLDPAVANELFTLLVRDSSGRPNTLMLSRSPKDQTRPVALAIFDALTRNRPVPLGEVTRLQVLSRITPGGADEELAQLQQRMIALASGKG